MAWFPGCGSQRPTLALWLANICAACGVACGVDRLPPEPVLLVPDEKLLARSDSYLAQMGADLVVVADDGLLKNDSQGRTAQTTLSVAREQTLLGGRVDVRPDGSFTYTPPKSLRGCDSFSYTLQTGTTTSHATVHVKILPGRESADQLLPFAGFVVDAWGSGVSDVNGDGRGELSFPGGLLLGSKIPRSGEWAALRQEPDLVWPLSGSLVAYAGDINSDSLGDFLMVSGKSKGADEADGELEPGRVWAVFGRRASGKKLPAIDMDGDTKILEQRFAYEFTTMDLSDEFGATLGSAGDVNGDGISDMLMGAPGVDYNPDDDAGAVYVVFGGQDTLQFSLGSSQSLMNLSLAGKALALLSNKPGERMGSFAKAAGDINQDGLDDLLIGVPGDSTVAEQAGRVTVIFGAEQGGVKFVEDAVSQGEGFSITTAEAGLNLGTVLSGGDINQDGYSDVLLGAPNSDGKRGAAYILWGRADTQDLALEDVVLQNRGQKLLGLHPGDEVGAQILWLPDVNQDGRNELALAAPGTSVSGAAGAGNVYVLFGAEAFPADALAKVPELSGGFVFHGKDVGDRLGEVGMSVQDINGDGDFDLILTSSAPSRTHVMLLGCVGEGDS